MIRRTLLAALLLCVAPILAVSTEARADAPPPSGYVEKCTMEKQRHAGEECEWCGA